MNEKKTGFHLTVKQSYRVKYACMYVFFALMAVCVVLVYRFGAEAYTLATATAVLGFGILLLGVVQGFAFMYCPHCGRGQNMRSKYPEICPFCRKSLDEGH